MYGMCGGLWLVHLFPAPYRGKGLSSCGEEECSEMSVILFQDTKVSCGVCTRRVRLQALTLKEVIKHTLIPSKKPVQSETATVVSTKNPSRAKGKTLGSKFPVPTCRFLHVFFDAYKVIQKSFLATIVTPTNHRIWEMPMSFKSQSLQIIWAISCYRSRGDNSFQTISKITILLSFSGFALISVTRGLILNIAYMENALHGMSEFLHLYGINCI